MERRRPPVWLIAGPTAAGKSALALRLATSIHGEIVNADSVQIYSEPRILSGRPGAADEARAPHHLFGIANPAEAWSVGRWLRAADAVLREIEARGRAAIVVGGTGLYFHALTRGLAAVPPVALADREAAARDLAARGETAFRQDLARVDPAAEARIAPGDRQRLVRAGSVAAATGRSLTAWQSAAAPAPLVAGHWRGVLVEPPREVLATRIEARLATMITAGAPAEVAALLARHLDPGLPALKTLGFAAIAEQLAGRLTATEAFSRAVAETRRYAKRQSTWFRNQTPEWPRIAAVEAEGQWRALQALANESAGGESDPSIDA